RHRGETCELDERRENSAVRAEDEARPEDDVRDPGGCDELLRLPLRAVVRHEVLRLLARAERAHVDEAFDARGLRRRQKVARTVHHHALKPLLTSLPNGNEVDDRVAPLGGSMEARRLRHVALGDRRAPRFQAHAFAPIADEGTHLLPGGPQRVHDVTADEPGAPGYEDQRVGSRWKFCQYFDGVGPRWPWYFEPSSRLPYGVAAGSLSWTKEICPIFMPG